MTPDRPETLEPAAVVARYARRAPGHRYSLLQPDVWQTVQERQRCMLRLFARQGWRDLGAIRMIEVGCGSGGNLLEFLRMGFRPEQMVGVELLPERLALARELLPAGLMLQAGDATQLDVAPASQDLVLQSTVFSSLLNDAFQERLADAMWSWLAPGGGVLWYDFAFNNPSNPDVRGVPMARVRALFPQARIWHCRLTLAPPLARPLCRVHPALYTLFNALPLLRTHRLAWIEKPHPP